VVDHLPNLVPVLAAELSVIEIYLGNDLACLLDADARMANLNCSDPEA
jgi:hypothetical protein